MPVTGTPTRVRLFALLVVTALTVLGATAVTPLASAQTPPTLAGTWLVVDPPNTGSGFHAATCNPDGTSTIEFSASGTSYANELALLLEEGDPFAEVGGRPPISRVHNVRG